MFRKHGAKSLMGTWSGECTCSDTARRAYLSSIESFLLVMWNAFSWIAASVCEAKTNLHDTGALVSIDLLLCTGRQAYNLQISAQSIMFPSLKFQISPFIFQISSRQFQLSNIICPNYKLQFSKLQMSSFRSDVSQSRDS